MQKLLQTNCYINANPFTISMLSCLSTRWRIFWMGSCGLVKVCWTPMRSRSMTTTTREKRRTRRRWGHVAAATTAVAADLPGTHPQVQGTYPQVQGTPRDAGDLPTGPGDLPTGPGDLPRDAGEEMGDARGTPATPLQDPTGSQVPDMAQDSDHKVQRNGVAAPNTDGLTEPQEDSSVICNNHPLSGL